MSHGTGLARVLRWARRLALLLVASYFSYSMLLLGYICVGTGLQPYGREHRLFYLTAGPLLILGGLAILAWSVRWLAGVLKARAEARKAAGEPPAA